jgi:enoyl-CoA hydratase/carnithine racemase
VSTFDDYGHNFGHVAMRRDDGILEMRVHTDDGSLLWGGGAKEIAYAFRAVADDPDNRVIILTGTGESFCNGREPNDPSRTSTPMAWDSVYRDGHALLGNLMAIGVPTIAAVNGPAHIHAELALLCDIVLASETATFADIAHFENGVVAGDGVHIVWPLLLGPNRGRTFLLLGQVIDASTALELGLVAEVMPQDQLVERAWEIARELARRPPLALRYTREAITFALKRQLADSLSLGLALEGLGSVQLAGWRMNQDGAASDVRRSGPA